MAATKDKNIIKKNGISMNLNKRNRQSGRKCSNFRLRGIPEGLSHQETNRNFPEEVEVEDDTYDKANWSNNTSLPRILDINVAHKYSHLEAKILYL